MVFAERFGDVAAGLAAAGPLLEHVPFELGEGWWRASVDAALPPRCRPLLLLAREAGRPALLLPLRRDGAALSSLTTAYSCRYAPLVAPGLAPAQVRQAAAACGRALRRWGSLKLEAMDADEAHLKDLLAGFAEAGWAHYTYAHFGNWHEDVSGLDHAAWLAARPGALREMLRRKLRKPFTLRIARGADEAAEALAIYENLHAASWKQPEPFPCFNAQLVGQAAAGGVLRFGVLWHEGVPVAAQYWIVEGGTACVLKLAHDEGARALSPGTVLTALMIQALFAEGGLGLLDFGRGDDPYKKDWVRARRQRIGVVLMNRRHPAGLARWGAHAMHGFIHRRA